MTSPDLGVAGLAPRIRGETRLERVVSVAVRDEVLEVESAQSFIVVTPADERTHERIDPYLDRLVERRAGVLLVGDLPPSLVDRLPRAIVAQWLPSSPGDDALCLALASLFERLDLLGEDRRISGALDRARYELREVTETARAISQERDITKLLDLILVKSRFITGADAGSIYVVETSDDGKSSRLRFKLSQNDSVKFESREFTLPVSTRSISGYAVVTKATINIPDVADIPLDAPYGYDGSFDRRVGYSTHSMIVVPMISAEDDVIGVIQLINKKRNGRAVLRTGEDFDREVVPFDARSGELLASLASQAGIALENALLYDEIRKIFEGFVRASVQAIEQRDPTTSGHSARVSLLSCELARLVDRVDSGPYEKHGFTPREIKELEYASLLHDFGKIGVREQVLVKAKKLYPHALDAIRERIHFVRVQAELEAARRIADAIRQGAGQSDLDLIESQLASRKAELADVYKTIVDANEPTVLKEGDFTRIGEISRLRFLDGDGVDRPLLEPDEVQSLSIRKGSLNDGEMDEIRSHVVHTFAFLSRIPWGKSFAHVAEIAGAHHEKLDGSGYPHGKKSAEIPVQSKIMTIADIYDALTARDRPYKKAMPVERALSILDFEVKDGHVDPELMRIFREGQVFKVVEDASLHGA